MKIIRTAALVAAGGLALAGCGSGSDRTARLEAEVAALKTQVTTTAAPTTTTSTTEAPTRTTVAPTTTTSNPQVEPMTQWMAFHSDDMETISLAASTIGLTQPVSVGAQNCQRLVTLAHGAKQSLPVPVVAVNVHYAKALELYEKAGTACSVEAGADTLYQATQFLNAAGPELSLAEQALGTYIGTHNPLIR